MAFPLTKDQVEDGDQLNGPAATRNWVAVYRGQIAGHAQISLDFRSGNALISKVAIAPDLRGQGLAVPMVNLVLDDGFASADIERVELHVYTWNEPAIRTYQRLGFKLEGVRRSSARVGKARWDTAFMGLLRRERDALSIQQSDE